MDQGYNTSSGISVYLVLIKIRIVRDLVMIVLINYYNNYVTPLASIFSLAQFSNGNTMIRIFF